MTLHGCGGLWRSDGTLTSRHSDWGERLRAWGYVVLFPDSYGSRGHTNLCKKKKRPVKFSHRVTDVRNAADWLATQPFVDGKKIALFGWSNGGSTLLRALAPGKSPRKTEFKTAIAFYPGCKTIVRKYKWRPRLKPLILMGAADDWTDPRPCRQLAGRWKSPIILYKGAYHGFDAPNSKVRVLKGRAWSARGDGVVHWGTNPEARRAAVAKVSSHLSKAFASP